jgi:hypothetical protein
MTSPQSGPSHLSLPPLYPSSAYSSDEGVTLWFGFKPIEKYSPPSLLRDEAGPVLLTWAISARRESARAEAVVAQSLCHQSVIGSHSGPFDDQTTDTHDAMSGKEIACDSSAMH